MKLSSSLVAPDPGWMDNSSDMYYFPVFRVKSKLLSTAYKFPLGLVLLGFPGLIFPSTFPSLTPLLVLSDIPFPQSYMHSNLHLRVCLRIAQLNTALSSLLYSILTPTHISPLKEKPLKLGEVCFLTHICLAQEPIPWGLVHLDLRSLSLPFCKTGLFPFTSPSTYRCLCPDSKSSTALLV